MGAETRSGEDTGGRTGGRGLFAAWERRVRLWALVFAGLTLLVSALIALVVIDTGRPAGSTLVLALAPAFGVYGWWTGKIRRRHAILREPFPREWEAVLRRDVVFFRALDPPAQQLFRSQLQVFLGEKQITGIKVKLDTTTRVLAAASAIIPIFGFPDWEWHQINEVLVYPTRFDDEFQLGDVRDHNILGMVGTGSLNRLMILSKPDLIDGFRNATDKRNVGVHEFAHLVDKTDGVIDGIPGVGLDRQAIGPWIDLVRRKMAEIEEGQSDIDRYALTNEAEFFAVTAEYFFERPGVMQRKHPELFATLERVFNQDLRARVGAMRRELTRGPGSAGTHPVRAAAGASSRSAVSASPLVISPVRGRLVRCRSSLSIKFRSPTVTCRSSRTRPCGSSPTSGCA